MARARCSAATPADPPGRMKLVSGSSVAFIASISRSSRSTCAGDDAQRAVDLAGRGDVGAEVEQFVLDAQQLVARSRRRASAAMATPIAALASSTSPIAVMRRLDLLTRLPSTSPALPPSPVRV